MPSLNPDFRGCDEVVVPKRVKFGWTDGTVNFEQAHLIEERGREQLYNEMPAACEFGEQYPVLDDVYQAWVAFQKSKGREEGSQDWTLLDEFLYQKVLIWLPQIIGSCVVSNSFRGWQIKLGYQIAFQGMPFEHLGRNEFGPNNYGFYGPWTYGAARKIAGMRGGDGLYCEALQKSFLKDGVLSCNTPALLEICKKLKVDKEKDFPEPQSASVYRSFGSWNYVEELRPYADYTLRECPTVKDVETLDKVLDYAGCTFFCSMIAVKKVGTHKDGFAIHARNSGDSWAHNMCFHGKFYASDKRKYYRFSNESWGAEHLYNVPEEEVATWFRTQRPSAASIGIINGPKSLPPLPKAA